jgi:alpha-ribazole phosphatase
LLSEIHDRRESSRAIVINVLSLRLKKKACERAGKYSLSDAVNNAIRSTSWWWLRHAPTGLSGQMIGASDVSAIVPPAQVMQQITRALPQTAAWIVSPLLRCQQTADALSGVAPKIEPAFAEQDFGVWEKLSYDVAQVRDATEFWNDPGNSAPPDGESFAAMAKRVQMAIERLSADAEFRDCPDIVVVAHAGVIRAAVALALNLSPAQALCLHVDPLSVTRLTRFETPDSLTGKPEVNWSVQCLNQGIVQAS